MAAERDRERERETEELVLSPRFFISFTLFTAINNFVFSLPEMLLIPVTFSDPALTMI